MLHNTACVWLSWVRFCLILLFVFLLLFVDVADAVLCEYHWRSSGLRETASPTCVLLNCETIAQECSLTLEYSIPLPPQGLARNFLIPKRYGWSLFYKVSRFALVSGVYFLLFLHCKIEFYFLTFLHWKIGLFFLKYIIQL